MKVKELFEALKSVDPEAEINITFYHQEDEMYNAGFINTDIDEIIISDKTVYLKNNY